MKEKVFNFATSTGSTIRSLPIVLGFILCVVIGIGGVAVLSWALDFITEFAESNLMKVICIGFVLYMAAKSKKGGRILMFSGIIGVIAALFAGYCLSLLVAASAGWCAGAVHDLLIPLMVAASIAAGFGVYKDDIQRIMTAAQNDIKSGSENKTRDRGNG